MRDCKGVYYGHMRGVNPRVVRPPLVGSRDCVYTRPGRWSALNPQQVRLISLAAPAKQCLLRLSLNFPDCCISYHSAWKISRERFMSYLRTRVSNAGIGIMRVRCRRLGHALQQKVPEEIIYDLWTLLHLCREYVGLALCDDSNRGGRGIRS